MDIRQNPLLLGFSLGRWWQTNVRVSLFFPLLAVSLCYQLGSLKLGLAATLVLFISVLFHEFCHVFMARRTGGSGDEILIWPLGGLAWVVPGPTFTSRFSTPAIGPVSNLILLLISLPAVLYHGAPPGTFHLIYVPDLQFNLNSLAFDFVVLFCSINLKLTVLNLLPIHPLDGSQVASEVGARYYPPEIARQGALWFGLLLCIVITAAAGMLHKPLADRDMMPIVVTGFLLMTLCMHEFYAQSYKRLLVDWSAEQDESFMGYDFSQGYAAFDGDEDVTPAEKRRQEMAEQRRMQEEREREEIRQRVDELLDKVHQNGLDSLTDAERRFLTQASKKYPSRG